MIHGHTMHSQSALVSRRTRFLEALGSGVAVLAAAPTRVRSNDSDYRYRPDSDLFYLTGFGEPEAVAVFAPNHPKHRFVLFVRPRDPERETWNGRRAGIDGAGPGRHPHPSRPGPRAAGRG